MKIRFFAKCSVVLLWFWFLFAVTGLSLGGTVFTASDFDLITFIWFVLYTIVVILYLIKVKVSEIIMLVFIFAWIAMQSPNWIFPKSENAIAGYNRIFEGSHYIIPSSNTIIVPNTYHLILFCLIVIAFIANSILVISEKRQTKA